MPRSCWSARAVRARPGCRCGWRWIPGSPATRRSEPGRRSGNCRSLKAPAPGVEREIWLWDFGGQADQRLIHQLYMDETALAVLVFDGQKEDLFETLGQMGPRSQPRLAQVVHQAAGRRPRGCRWAARQPEPGGDILPGARLHRLPGNQRQARHRLRGTQNGDPGRDPVGRDSVALLAPAFQALEGGNPALQGRRPRADALQRTA